MLYLGDIVEDQVIEFLFSSNDLLGQNANLEDSPALAVYKSGSTSESTSSNGITLTAPYDSVVGLNHVQVDTSASAFYEPGKDYALVFTAGEIDGISIVGKVLANFSIENRNAGGVSGTVDANVTKWAGSNVATPASAGHPVVTLAATTHTGAVVPTVTDVTNLHASAATAANQTTILARLGAWTGSGANTVLGALRALFRSDADAAIPSDINADLGSGAGTADNTTDSVQAIAAAVDGIEGGGGGGGDCPTASQIVAEMDSNSTALAAIAAALVDVSTFDPTTDAVTVGAIAADAIEAAAIADDALAAIGDAVAAAGDVYHADIEFTADAIDGQDEYTATWFKNGVRLTEGITSPKIQVVQRVDGTDLVAETDMTQVGSTGSYKFTTDSARVPVAEAVLVIVRATIDGETREFSRLATGY